MRAPALPAAVDAAWLRLLDEINEGVYLTDRRRRIVFWNKAAERISGYKRREVLGRPCAANILIHVDGRGRSMCRGICPLARTLGDGCRRRGEIFLHHKDGHRVPVHVRVLPLRDGRGAITGAAELFSDISDKLDLGTRLEELRHLAMVDRLTGVGNRYHTEKSLEARLEEFRRFKWPLGIIFFDIDDFKQVNDRHSHRIGDRALRMVARTLQANVRSIDQVGRWGGDEFLVLLRNADRRSLRRIAEKLRLLVEGSVFWVKDVPVRVTLSGGAAMARPGDSLMELVERADRIMYQAKRAGKNRVQATA
jgi:diguanylate cyclase (GGDEF)-like protein/PAS domain S-box-containing protein